MPRLHLFELHDQPWVPEAVRESVVEVLGLTMKWGGILDAITPIFRRFIARTGAEEVLELCSGSGLGARLLLERLSSAQAAGRGTRITLSDRDPRPALWEQLCQGTEGLSFAAPSVDATAVPAHLDRGRPRLILNAFHHFPPPVARAILTDAHNSSAGIFIAENFGRNPLETLPCGFWGIPAAFANPAITRRSRILKTLLTFPLPAIPLAVAWDGFVSSLRVYSARDLLRMTADLTRFEWHHGSFSYPPFGRGRFFYGVPRPAARDLS